METVFSNHKIDAELSNDVVLVVINDIITGESIHWSWPKSLLNDPHLNQKIIDSIDDPMTAGAIQGYMMLDKYQMAGQISMNLAALNKAIQNEGVEDEQQVYNNIGWMLVLPYIIKTKAWETINTNETVSHHNTIYILKEEFEGAYIMRPCSTANHQTYESALNDGLSKVYKLAYQVGWLKWNDKVGGHLVNENGMTIQDLLNQKPKKKRGTNKTQPKKKRK